MGATSVRQIKTIMSYGNSIWALHELCRSYEHNIRQKDALLEMRRREIDHITLDRRAILNQMHELSTRFNHVQACNADLADKLGVQAGALEAARMQYHELQKKRDADAQEVLRYRNRLVALDEHTSRKIGELTEQCKLMQADREKVREQLALAEVRIDVEKANTNQAWEAAGRADNQAEIYRQETHRWKAEVDRLKGIIAERPGVVARLTATDVVKATNEARYRVDCCAKPHDDSLRVYGDVPLNIVRYAEAIAYFFSVRGVHRWELADVCSRNHSDRIQTLNGRVETLEQLNANQAATIRNLQNLPAIQSKLEVVQLRADLVDALKTARAGWGEFAKVSAKLREVTEFIQRKLNQVTKPKLDRYLLSYTTLRTVAKILGLI